MDIEKEQKARKVAIWVIGLMTAIWVVLSIFSFTDTKDRVRPRTENITFEGVTALKGKQVFQAYSCMDCHTIVGNGAYFAPDLTKIYEKTGPAWLKAYLGSPGTYPTKAIVDIQLKQMLSKGQQLPADIDAYLEKFPGAQERVEDRGGVKALMPNLQFSAEEIDALIAYFIYTGKINTAGWPPKVIADPEVVADQARKLEESSGIFRFMSPSAANTSQSTDNTAATTASPAILGAQVAKQFACTACHSADGSKVVGPTFKGLYGTAVPLADGTTVNADDAYLTQSILEPNAHVVKGYQQGVMPSFKGTISDDQVSALIAYIKSLK